MRQRPVRAIREFLRGVAIVSMTAAVVAVPVLVSAQTSTADALNLYNSLSSEEQQAILQQLEGQAGNSGSTSDQNGRNKNQQRLVNQKRSAGDQLDRSKDDVSFSNLPASNLLGPGDTVLVEFSVRREPVTTDNQGALQAQAQAQTQQRPLNADGTPATVVTTQTVLGPEITLTTLEREQAQKLIDQVRVRNPYVLDRNGAVQLPGFEAMALAGLNPDEAAKRISADPSMQNLEAKLTRLPLKKSGLAALKPFGYDLFDDSVSTFAPLGDVPVPNDYVVGPGDTLNVQLYGGQNRTLNLTVSRDGRINLPQLGPINVAGMRFSDLRADIERRVSKQMIGVNASLSMGEVRSLQVFVLGAARAPGAYTVSGLSTITSALYASGGVKPIGSLRDIQLKRQGTVVRHLDLYDLLLRGDTSNDAKLQAGDVIFIPAVGPTVTADGEVQRPAVYESRGNETLKDLVFMAGGLTPQADAALGSVARVDDQRRRVVLSINLADAGRAAQPLHNGDVLTVSRLKPTLDSGVVLQGYVYRPGSIAWRDGMRLSEVIPSIDELKPDADQHYVLIRREIPPDRRIAVLSADLAAALRAPGSAADIALQPRDRLTVFDLSSDRERVIAPLMNELKVQGAYDQPTESVTISGKVKVPGDYPLEPGMKIADLIRAGGTLNDAAYGGTAELSRYVIENGQTRRTQVVNIDLAAVLKGDSEANIPLQPYDGVYIKEISGWSKQEQVTLKGEVRFPGTYAIQSGETLRSVVQRAGGLTELGSAEGAVFMREDLRVREQEQLDRLADRIQNDLVAMSLMIARGNQGNAQQTYSVGQTLVSQLKTTKAVGRLVIDLNAAIHAGGGSQDIVLRDGDTLAVPKRSQEVTVMGEVQNVTSHLYKPSLTRGDYITLSGGMTRQADTSHIYVVRASGSVVASSARWFSGNGQSIRPGDTVVVPLNTDRIPQLTLWQGITEIVYNSAIAVAALNSL